MRTPIASAVSASLFFLAGCGAAQTPSQDAIPADAATLDLPRIGIVRAYSSDLERGDRFYRNVFGLQDGRGSHDRERVLSFGDSARPVVILALSDTPPVSQPFPAFAVVVSDMNSVIERIEQYGGSVYMPPRELSAGELMAFVRDPDGNQIEILQMPAAGAR